MRRVVAVVAVGLAAALLAGCGQGGGQEPVGLASTTASTSATRPPTPTETAKPEVDDLSDPELGISFTDVPDLTGDEADVYNWVATYQLEYWRTLITNTVSPGFDVIAGPEAKAQMVAMVAQNTENGSQVGGSFATRVYDVVVDGDTATAHTCDDLSQVVVVDPEGTHTAADLGVAEPISRSFTLKRIAAEDRWVVGAPEAGPGC